MNINDMVGYIMPKEIQTLREYASEVEGACVNIGTFQGKSAIAMALENEEVYTIDRYEYELYDQYVKEFDVKINKIVGKAQDVKWDKPIGLLFIDGDHGYESVMGDYLNFKDHVVVGGVIIFHDYKNEQYFVCKVLEDLKEEMKNYHAEKTIGDMLCLRKIK